MQNEFEIGGRKFKVRKIDAMKQFHIVRRVTPILAEVLPALKSAGKFASEAELKKLPDDKKWDLVTGIAGPTMNGLSKLEDKDADLVLHGLLEAVEVQQTGGNWAKISSGGMLMMQDLELPVLLQVAGRAFIFNLSGFFSALPQS